MARRKTTPSAAFFAHKHMHQSPAYVAAACSQGGTGASGYAQPRSERACYIRIKHNAYLRQMVPLGYTFGWNRGGTNLHLGG